LPKPSWKAVPQPLVSSRETSVPSVAVGPPGDTSLQDNDLFRRQLTISGHVSASQFPNFPC